MALIYSFGPWSALFWSNLGVLLAWLACLASESGARLLRDKLDVEVLPGPPPIAWPRAGAFAYFERRDALEALEGIDPAIAAVLRASGIVTFDDLGSRTVDSLRDLLQATAPTVVSKAEPASWPVQARLIAMGRIEAFAALAKVLDEGHVPLACVLGAGVPEPTPGPQVRAWVLALEGVGIHSVEQLAAHPDARDLRAAPSSTGSAEPASRAAEWIERARRLESGDEDAYFELIDPAIVARMQEVAVPYPLTRQYERDLRDAARLWHDGAATEAIAASHEALVGWWRSTSERMHRRPGARCRACRSIGFLALVMIAWLVTLWGLGVRPL